jgi:putative flavoprotein involved in K+ transport
MSVENVETLIVGGGQAGLAMSEHLGKRGLSHLVVERHRIAERWRTERWDSLVANGPAWHDRFPTQTFADIDPDSFATKDRIVAYMEAHAKKNNTPIRCGIEVTSLERKADGSGFRADTTGGMIEAKNVVVATGPFQKPLIPTVVPAEAGVMQIHSNAYRNPRQLPDGAVLVVGAGSSGAQIADELLRAGKTVFLSVGPHDRPPRAYRGKDFVWWLGALGKWDAKTIEPGMEHVTIAVSGAYGGHTVDFRRLAERGVTLVGRAEKYSSGELHFATDVAQNVARGDANYLSVLDEADSHIAQHKLDFPEEPDARKLGSFELNDANATQSLNLRDKGITSIVWATGFALDFGWMKTGEFDDKGRPVHQRGVSTVPGLYFLGLAWLSRRASPFIWGVWHDAEYLASKIAP